MPAEADAAADVLALAAALAEADAAAEAEALGAADSEGATDAGALDAGAALGGALGAAAVPQAAWLQTMNKPAPAALVSLRRAPARNRGGGEGRLCRSCPSSYAAATGGLEDRGGDVVIGATAAQVAGHGGAHLSLRRLGRGLQEGYGLHDLAGLDSSRTAAPACRSRLAAQREACR